MQRAGIGRLNETYVWNAHQSPGEENCERVRGEASAEAPEPGSVVLIEASVFRGQAGVEPVLFSSLDICTHLQLARPYFHSSTAAAVDFLEFLILAFPFPVHEVRTSDHWFFSTLTGDHPFTRRARQFGVRHVVLPPDSNPDILRRLSYPGRAFPHEPDENLSGALRKFLHLHNHQRSLSTLGGKTPLEVLRSFPGFGHVTRFDPFSHSSSF